MRWRAGISSITTDDGRSASRSARRESRPPGGTQRGQLGTIVQEAPSQISASVMSEGMACTSL